MSSPVDLFRPSSRFGSHQEVSPPPLLTTIISTLQSSLPGIDLGFGVGRFEEYGNFADEYATGRPFALNQPIVAASTTEYMTANAVNDAPVADNDSYAVDQGQRSLSQRPAFSTETPMWMGML